MNPADRSEGDAIVLRDAPSVPGLVFRRLKPGADYPETARVWSGSYEADGLDVVWTSEDASLELSAHGEFDPGKDFIIAEVDGVMVGGAMVWSEERPMGVRTYNSHASLVAEWRGRGIREAMLKFCERRLTEIAKGHDSSARKFFETSARQRDNDWKRIIEEAGYVPVRYNISMVRPLDTDTPKTTLPPGTELRPVKIEQWSLFWRESSEAFRDERNWSEQRFGDEAVNRWRGTRNWQPELWISVWCGDKMVGGSMSMIDSEENKKMSRNWGWIAMIFVAREWRRKGIGRALVAESLRILRSSGVDTAALAVDTENPSGALTMYKNLGFVEFDRYMICQKPVP